MHVARTYVSCIAPVRPLSHYTNLNKKCAEIYVLILLGDFCNQFLTLLDDSWTVGRTKNFWKFVEHVQKICDSLISLARSWTLFGPSWQHLSGFLMVSQLFLTRLGRSWRERKIGVNEKELVKNSQEEFRSCQDALKKRTRTCIKILAAWQGAVEMLSRCAETSPRSIKKYQEGVAIPFQDAPDISRQHGNRPLR